MNSAAADHRSDHDLSQCESIRGIAILLVFWFHHLGGLYGYLSRTELPTGLGLLFGGTTGVTLFFVLSGFLLTRPFFMGRPLDTGQYFMRRALRILPMYYVAVFIGALASGEWGSVWKALLFYDITLDTLSPMGSVWWSLAIEVQFYLLLPVIVWLATHKGWRLLLIPALLGAIYTYAMIRSATPTGPWSEGRDNILGRWPVFMIGALLAWSQVMVARRAIAMPGLLGLPLVLCALTALMLACDHRVRAYGFLAHGFWFDHYVIEGLAWAMFIFALLNFRFAGYRLFVNPWLHRLGLWSYSIYLLHSGVLHLSRQMITWKLDEVWLVAGGGVLLLLITASISALTYRWIELPFLRLNSRVVRLAQTQSMRIKTT